MAALSLFQQARKLKTANWAKKVRSQFQPKGKECINKDWNNKDFINKDRMGKVFIVLEGVGLEYIGHKKKLDKSK